MDDSSVSDDVAQLRSDLVVATERVDSLERALLSSRRIGAAVGIVMAHNHVSLDEAFALVRARSQNGNRKLRDVADEIIRTGVFDGRSR